MPGWRMSVATTSLSYPSTRISCSWCAIGVVMLDPMRMREIGPDQVMEKFGVGPDKVTEVQALAGDSTDNVPGVPGIGVKTAAQLIGEYGDLDSLLDARRGNQAAQAPAEPDRSMPTSRGSACNS